MSHLPASSDAPSKACIGLVVIAVTLYTVLLAYMAVNIPFQDDIHDVLEFLLAFNNAPASWQALQVLFAPNNVHMAVFPRAIYLADYALTGQVNFITLAAIANFALLLIALLLGRLVIAGKQRWFFLALASLVIFTPRAYDLVLFPMSSISFYYASLFTILAIICLRQVTAKRFMLALIFAGLATLTNASGQLAMLMGFTYLLYQWLFTREKIAIYCLGWLVFSCLLAALLFIVKDDSAMPQAFITQAENIGATPMHYLKFFLALLGSTLSFHSTALSIAMGAGLLVLVLLLCLEKLLKAKVDAAVFISFFFIGCAAAISYGRGPYVTVDYALTSRYSYQSTFLIACTLVMLVNRHTAIDYRQRIMATALAVVFFVASYASYLKPFETHVNQRIHQFNKGKYSTYFHPLETTNNIVNAAIEQGIYSPPERPVKKKKLAINSLPYHREKVGGDR